jgi:hypothetical protein
MLPSRSNRRNLSVELAPGNRLQTDPLGVGLEKLPILDGAKSALHGPDGPPDLPLVLAEWFLGRADRTGDVWLWTGTFDPDRIRRGDRKQAPRDRVGHRGAVDALSRWHDQLLAYAPGADALVGVEAHKSGARHAHAAVVAPPEFRFQWVAQAWYEANGYNVWERADWASGAARYAAKYVGKELGVYDVAFAGGRLRL